MRVCPYRAPGSIEVACGKLAESACRRRLPPVRRSEPGNPAAFLIDKHGCIVPTDRQAQRLYERLDLRRIMNIAREKNEPDRVRIAEERLFVGAQFQSAAADRKSTRLNPSH